MRHVGSKGLLPPSEGLLRGWVRTVLLGLFQNILGGSQMGYLGFTDALQPLALFGVSNRTGWLAKGS